MAKSPAFRSGDIWRFPISDGRDLGYLRVLLRIDDLELPKEGPLDFVRGMYLVQLSRCADVRDFMFSPKHLLVASTFVAQIGPWEGHGYEWVGSSEVSLRDIEFPCSFDFFAPRGVTFITLLCRGEFEYKCVHLDEDYIVNRWGRVCMTVSIPSSLGGAFTRSRRGAKRVSTVDFR